MNTRVLLVDDDPNVLAGYKRQLRKTYAIETAQSGPEGMEVLARSEPFAVVVSDMRMPGMDGINFLRNVRSLSPDSVRIMLTGNADVQTCIDAVNEGSIFRFLTKPCSTETMTSSLDSAIEQYRLITSERELLQGTLRGCIRTLTDIIGLLNPAAFSRSTRIRRYVRHIAAELNSPYFWEYEMAATLSHIGCIALPPEILARMSSGRSLTSEQLGMLANHPSLGCQLLAEIPRLEMVAQIVERQRKVPRNRTFPPSDLSEEQAIDFGALLLRFTLDLDTQLQKGRPFIEALSALHSVYGNDHPMLEALMSFEKDDGDRVVMRVTTKELSNCMVAAEDILSTTGHVLLPKGQRLTEPVRLHLMSCAQTNGLKEPFLVEVVSMED